MNGWVDGWKNRKKQGKMDKWIAQWRKTVGTRDKWMDRQMNS